MTITGITMKATYDGTVEQWGSTMDKWYVSLTYDGRNTIQPFFQGLGHNQAEPTIPAVLQCMLADAAMWEELGNDPDAWLAAGYYEIDDKHGVKDLLALISAVRQEVGALKLLFGPDYDEALLVDWDTWSQ